MACLGRNRLGPLQSFRWESDCRRVFRVIGSNDCKREIEPLPVAQLIGHAPSDPQELSLVPAPSPLKPPQPRSVVSLAIASRLGTHAVHHFVLLADMFYGAPTVAPGIEVSLRNILIMSCLSNASSATSRFNLRFSFSKSFSRFA